MSVLLELTVLHAFVTGDMNHADKFVINGDTEELASLYHLESVRAKGDCNKYTVCVPRFMCITTVLVQLMLVMIGMVIVA